MEIVNGSTERTIDNMVSEDSKLILKQIQIILMASENAETRGFACRRVAGNRLLTNTTISDNI